MSCTAVSQTQCRQLKLHCLMTLQNASVCSLLMQISPILMFTSLASPCDLPFGCLTCRPSCSDSQASFLPFPCFWLPRDVSFSLKTRNNCSPCGNQEFQPHFSQENWLWALLSLFWCLHVLCQHHISARSPQFRVEKERICRITAAPVQASLLFEGAGR